MKYNGSVEELIKALNGKNWKFNRNCGSISLQITTENKMIINFYETTKTISIQGKANEHDKKILMNIIDDQSCGLNNNVDKIYIVHGHDENALRDLKLMLREWGLEPIVSQDQPVAGQTILDGVLSDLNDCAFGLVLLTPDDEGRAINKDEEIVPRARQNVIFEFGILISKMRDKTAILRKGNTDIPTDMSGLKYIPFEEKLDELKSKLKRALEWAKIKIVEKY
jgi:predicted nucleotide-binding protein